MLVRILLDAFSVDACSYLAINSPQAKHLREQLVMLPLLPPLGREDMVEHRAMLLVELRPVLLVQLAQGFEAVAAVGQLYERKRSALDLAHQQVVQRASDIVGVVRECLADDRLWRVASGIGPSSPSQQAAAALQTDESCLTFFPLVAPSL